MIREISRFQFTLPHGNRKNIARVQVFKPKGGNVTVFIQHRKDNHGKSHTNAIEYVAPQLCKKLKIDPKRLVLIDGPGYFYKGHDENEWDRVAFTHRRGDKWGKPKWTPLGVKEWRKLFEAATGSKLV